MQSKVDLDVHFPGPVTLPLEISRQLKEFYNRRALDPICIQGLHRPPQWAGRGQGASGTGGTTVPTAHIRGPPHLRPSRRCASRLATTRSTTGYPCQPSHLTPVQVDCPGPPAQPAPAEPAEPAAGTSAGSSGPSDLPPAGPRCVSARTNAPGFLEHSVEGFHKEAGTTSLQ